MPKVILVAEDFATSRNVIKSTLEKKGFIVITAEDGRDALKHFNGQTIDLVITDFNMPHLDGAELAKEIRSLTAYKSIPILVLSTETNRQKKEKAQEAKITGWIKKPFQSEEFLDIVNRVLRH